MLTVEQISAGYGSVAVLHDVSLAVAPGETVCVLGRNGAGKTTLLKSIMGLLPLTAGRVRVGDTVISELPGHEVGRYGLAFVPQGRRLFPGLTVRENLEMGMQVNDAGDETLEGVLDLFPDLKERRRQQARTLSGGQQQMVAMARALCAKPKYLLLDEPGEGLMPTLVDRVMQTVTKLAADGVGILLVEQKVEAALHVADRVLFLENGRVRHESRPAELATDPAPLQQYVGVKR